MAVSGTCGVYKYVHKKLGIIYVGHSATSVETRIKAHKSEEAFAPYLDDCCVYICGLPNKSVAIAMELLLIDHYRPVLNTYSKEDWPYTGRLPELNWTPYLAWRDTASAAKEAKDMKRIRILFTILVMTVLLMVSASVWAALPQDGVYEKKDESGKVTARMYVLSLEGKGMEGPGQRSMVSSAGAPYIALEAFDGDLVSVIVQ